MSPGRAGGLRVLRHAIHQTAKLLDYGLDELLLVPIVLAELSKNVVLFAGVLHSGQKSRKSEGHIRNAIKARPDLPAFSSRVRARFLLAANELLPRPPTLAAVLVQLVQKYTPWLHSVNRVKA